MTVLVDFRQEIFFNVFNSLYYWNKFCDLWDILLDQLWELFTIKVAYVGSFSNIHVHTNHQGSW